MYALVGECLVWGGCLFGLGGCGGVVVVVVCCGGWCIVVVVFPVVVVWD